MGEEGEEVTLVVVEEVGAQEEVDAAFVELAPQYLTR